MGGSEEKVEVIECYHILFCAFGVFGYTMLSAHASILLLLYYYYFFRYIPGKTHGGPSDGQRMVGDVGNITADDSGTAVVEVTDAVVSLVGPHSIIGRSLVLFASEDDQGRGGQENSLTTGNAGPRIAAGVVGIVV